MLLKAENVKMRCHIKKQEIKKKHFKKIYKLKYFFGIHTT